MDTLSTGTVHSSTHSEISKTGSSWSASGSATANDKEQDFTKDNTTTPIDLECKIQAERITKILDEAIFKIKCAICFPVFVQDETFSSIINPQELEEFLFIFEQYENPMVATSTVNFAAMEDIKAGDLTLRNRLNPELGHLIHVLTSYEELSEKVVERVEELREDYNKMLEEKMNYSASIVSMKLNDAKLWINLEYLIMFEKFRDLMVEQMNTTAAEELTRKFDTRRLKASNDKLIHTILGYKKELKEAREIFEANMKDKMDTIARLEQELSFLKHDASINLKKKILDSERQMVLASRAHAIKSEVLKEEELETRETYEALLRNHLVEEKNMRARRFKVETQLLSWIQKYDLEMTDKQAELDEFTEKYEEELKKCEDLEAKLAEQDIEFIPLMAEREEEYHQEMTEKMNKFLVDHAARVIQNAWREVLANRAEKKRLKKLQKKMQAAAAPKGKK